MKLKNIEYKITSFLIDDNPSIKFFNIVITLFLVTFKLILLTKMNSIITIKNITIIVRII